jgi:hypothetical protein
MARGSDTLSHALLKLPGVGHTMNEKIEAAIAFLEEESLTSDHPPSMVVMPPNMGESIVGNRGGFLRLSIAAAKAAQGQDQNLNKQPWVRHEDFDWQIKSLSFDDSAHIYLPEKPTKWQRRRQNALGLAVGLFLLGCLATGFITIVRWVIGWPR